MNFVRVIINLFQFNRTNWKAVILCLLAAAIFWLFNAFNKNHSSTIRFPLHFDYDGQRYVAVGPLPHQININVTGSGWELFRKTWGVKLPELVIPLDRPLEIKKIPTSALPTLLMAQLGSLHINYIITDTLHIKLEEKVTKTFRLSADVTKIKFKEGYGLTGARLLPDSVVIDGPKSIFKTIPDTIALMVNATGINKSFRDELEVPLFNSVSINRNPPVVTVFIEAGPVEAMEVSIKVEWVHPPRAVKAIADSVKAVIQIPVDQKVDFQARLYEITVRIDLKSGDKNGHALYPKVIGLPPYARVISIDTLSYKID